MNDEVKIVAITQPTISLEPTRALMRPSQFIAYCARVSNPSNQHNDDSNKLLNYCMKHQHWSIFEMVHVVIEINTTRDIGRQILRHRSFSFQEFSQRYADPTSQEFVIREARLQDEKNRQNSIEIDDEELQRLWTIKQQQIVHEAKLAYKWAVEKGIAKEQARAVLPEGNTPSKMYVSGNLRSWIHYCQLRTQNGTQKEHREIARKCLNLIAQHFAFVEQDKPENPTT